MPLTIDASQDYVDPQGGLTSPIVINDKMLSQSADLPSNDAAQNEKFMNYIDSDALNNILMDFNSPEEFERNLI